MFFCTYRHIYRLGQLLSTGGFQFYKRSYRRWARLHGTQAEATCPLVFLWDLGEVICWVSAPGRRLGAGYGADALGPPVVR